MTTDNERGEHRAFVQPSPRGLVKSSRSNHGVEGDCVEVAGLPDRVAMRDSKDPTGPALAFGCAKWQAFISGIRAGELG